MHLLLPRSAASWTPILLLLSGFGATAGVCLCVVRVGVPLLYVREAEHAAPLPFLCALCDVLLLYICTNCCMCMYVVRMYIPGIAASSKK